MELFLDTGDERGLSTQLYDQIREAIAAGRLPPGGRLKPSRAVAQGLGIARSTVTDAYARLTAEGHVEGRRGGGSMASLPDPCFTPRRRQDAVGRETTAELLIPMAVRQEYVHQDTMGPRSSPPPNPGRVGKERIIVINIDQIGALSSACPCIVGADNAPDGGRNRAGRRRGSDPSHQRRTSAPLDDGAVHSRHLS